MRRTINKTILLLFGLVYLTSCGSEEKPRIKGGFYHGGIYFGQHLPPHYQQGIIDGCTTAKGVYQKSHTLFNNDENYHNGWFLGRNRCEMQ